MPHFAPRRRARLVAALGGAILVAAVTLIAASGDDSATGARRVATAYLAAWAHADPAAMATLLDAPPPDLGARLGWLPRAATGASSHFTLNGVGGPAAHRQASYRAHEEVGGFGPLEWDGTLPGTEEFGHADPPQTHAWFVGYHGTLALAVLVEGGGVGGRVAAPLAGRFVSALPAR